VVNVDLMVRRLPMVWAKRGFLGSGAVDWRTDFAGGTGHTLAPGFRLVAAIVIGASQELSFN